MSKEYSNGTVVEEDLTEWVASVTADKAQAVPDSANVKVNVRKDPNSQASSINVSDALASGIVSVPIPTPDYNGFIKDVKYNMLMNAGSLVLTLPPTSNDAGQWEPRIPPIRVDDPVVLRYSTDLRGFYVGSNSPEVLYHGHKPGYTLGYENLRPVHEVIESSLLTPAQVARLNINPSELASMYSVTSIEMSNIQAPNLENTVAHYVTLEVEGLVSKQALGEEFNRKSNFVDLEEQHSFRLMEHDIHNAQMNSLIAQASSKLSNNEIDAYQYNQIILDATASQIKESIEMTLHPDQPLPSPQIGINPPKIDVDQIMKDVINAHPSNQDYGHHISIPTVVIPQWTFTPSFNFPF